MLNLFELNSIIINQRAGAFARFRRVITPRTTGDHTNTLIPEPVTERTRQLTRILDLRALAGVEQHVDGMNYREWLHSLLLRLRNVRCVLFEDFAPLNADCLLYLRIHHDWDLDGSPRMLVARTMHIPTSTYLGHFVLGFGNVSYLDLSKTTCAGDQAFLDDVAQSGCFQNVGVLKLRGVNLDDNGLRAIVYSARRSIWSLDVRNNKLTSRSLAYLLRFCVQPPSYDLGGEYSSYVEGEDQLNRAIKYLSNGQTKGILRGTGLTHLHIADNDPGFLAPHVAALLASGRLVFVDVGISWPSRQTSSGLLESFPEPSAGSAQLRDELAPPRANPDTYLIGRSMRYKRVHHTYITGQCLGYDNDLDITELASRQEGGERVEELLAKKDFMGKEAQAGSTELVLMDLPAVSRLGFLSRGLQVFLNELAHLEHLNKKPTALRKLVLEFAPSAVPKVFGDNSKPPDIPLRHTILPPTDRMSRDPILTRGVETSSETPAQVPWEGIITRALRRYWAADPRRWSGEVVFRAGDSTFFW